MSVLSSLAAVQYYTALDPYNWQVDNRPLSDLDDNVQLVAGEVDKSLISKNLLARALGEAFASTTGPDCAVGAVTNVGSWQLDYTRLVVNQSYNVDVASIQRIGVIAKFGGHDPGLLAAFTKPVTANSTRTWLVEARVVNTIAGETFVNSPDSDLSANNFVGSVEIQVLDYGSDQAGQLVKDDPTLHYPSTTAGWIPLHRVCLYDTSVSLQMNLHVTDMNFYHLGTVDSRQLATTNTPADGKVLFAEPGVGGTYNTYGMHWDYPLPTPPNSGKVLTSTSALPGGYSWQDPVTPTPTVTPASDNPGVILIANANGISSRVKVSPFKSGKVVIQGTEYTLDPAGYNIDTNALTINRMHAVYLVPGAPYAGMVCEIMPDNSTSQSGYVPAYDNTYRQTLRMHNVTAAMSQDHLFVGHIYINVWVSTLAYYNMAQVYVRSYYNDYGTASSVFNNNADPALTVWDSPAFTISQKDGRVNNEARMKTGVVGVPWAANTWGYGSTPADFPKPSSGVSLYASHVPPSTDLVLGTILWPHEIVEVTGVFDAYISQGPGNPLRVTAIRAWDQASLINNPPAPITVGLPVTSSSIYATCIAFQPISNSDDANGSYSRNATTLTGKWRYDNSVWFSNPYTARFQIFDMIWQDYIMAYGFTDPGCTRLSITHQTNRVPMPWLGGY